MKFLSIPILLGLLYGCYYTDDCSDCEYTAAGLCVEEIEDFGSISSGVLSKSELYGWLDSRVNSWVQERSSEGYQQSYLEATARSIRFRLVDWYKFYSMWSPTQAAVGETDGSSYIKACIWDHNYQQVYPDGIGLGVIGHELDHCIGINH